MKALQTRAFIYEFSEKGFNVEESFLACDKDFDEKRSSRRFMKLTDCS